MTSSDLFGEHSIETSVVECLGHTFSSEEERREYFSRILADHLADPDFLRINGFPKGNVEDILALSDPPYYTACPNPFLSDFLRSWSRDGEVGEAYAKEPFYADVSEGKNDPIYNAHSYHTKAPHKAIMRFILHYTQPGDVVFDGFCGTGMTGVAAQLCGNRFEVESLGYRVDEAGTVFQNRGNASQPQWEPFSRLGSRHAILNDLSPAATFIASNYTSKVGAIDFEKDSREIFKQVLDELGWMYETKHIDGQRIGKINYTIWSDVFACPNCAGEIVFWDVAVDRLAGKIHDEFACPHCSTSLNKRSMERYWISGVDSLTGDATKLSKQVPVWINYSVGSKRFEKRPDADDIENFESIDRYSQKYWCPTAPVPSGDKTGEPVRLGISRAHQFYTTSSLAWLSALRAKAPRLDHRYLVAFSMVNTVSKMYRYVVKKPDYKGQGGGILSGTLYIPSLNRGLSVTSSFERGLSRLAAIFDGRREERAVITTESASNVRAPDNSIDYIFLDPPFGANIMYSELNYLWESWLKVSTNNKPEAIQNATQGKGIDEYRGLMTKCFREAFRILKPGRWMTVEFSNTQAAVWNAIQTSLQEAGFVVANVAALDKKQGSFNAINNKTSVKQDLVISAYKPDGDIECSIVNSGGSGESVWDFVRMHLKRLPVVKVKSSGLEFISERDPRIIFDRMVSWFVRHGIPVPMSSAEFQAGLGQRFTERDGMFFLAEQVASYDRKRLEFSSAPQMDLFVSDERSAVDWLSNFLARRPSTYQDIAPEFMAQLGAGWKKHEVRPELAELLESSFLKYDGTGEVPSQIHTYLSSNFRELRGLDKLDPVLRVKAQDRWFVPDPSKAQDLEKKREKALLKEFDGYVAATGRKLKEFRLEVLRAGFKTAWASRDYQTIIKVAQKIPEEALQEDEKLLLWYDQALTRVDAAS
jgi:DNA modification methylase